MKYKFKIGDSVINEWNWKCFIVGRFKDENGKPYYIVESEEDEDFGECDKQWTLSQEVIKRKL